VCYSYTRIGEFPCALWRLAARPELIAYEYGNKDSIAYTENPNIIVGVVSHESNLHDSHTLLKVLSQIENNILKNNFYPFNWSSNHSSVI